MSTLPATTLFVGTRKGLFRVTQGPTGWAIQDVSFLAENVSLVLPRTAPGGQSLVYAALEHGHFGPKLHGSRDGGLTWQELQSPKFPPRPEGTPEDLNPITNKPIPWSVVKIWSLTAGGDPDELFCGTIPGGLFHSRDGGHSWSFVSSLWDHPGRKKWMGGGAEYPGIHSIVVDPRDANVIRLAVSCGGVWETRDRGATWHPAAQGLRADYCPPEHAYDQETQDPHLLVQCLSAPDHLWIQHHNGIFRSTDGAKSWTEITTATPSHFGFPVAVHPRDPLRAWFVPAQKDEHRIPVSGQVVVSHTRDGGQHFEILKNGLPQAHAYDLIYRHALAIDDSGDRLAMGSTTGSLWLTEDQGQHWQSLSSHLPPIYSVAFVPTH
jgi:photosystem II stability/assembly factor-like uncharacterized protein